ncbi:hypothetical protein I4F81_008981 [Pyropia yezoensis]|uniref:Uncharacterized protein n=1 Tax=Pyropia yezoensis TaxID=2788 RepID=A0ACC3C9L9_PYRYE|nr:hypothetical protein I4F81_008981 [Neopyropia yezoensis]
MVAAGDPSAVRTTPTATAVGREGGGCGGARVVLDWGGRPPTDGPVANVSSAAASGHGQAAVARGCATPIVAARRGGGAKTAAAAGAPVAGGRPARATGPARAGGGGAGDGGEGGRRRATCGGCDCPLPAPDGRTVRCRTRPRRPAPRRGATPRRQRRWWRRQAVARGGLRPAGRCRRVGGGGGPGGGGGERAWRTRGAGVRPPSLLPQAPASAPVTATRAASMEADGGATVAVAGAETAVSAGVVGIVPGESVGRPAWCVGEGSGGAVGGGGMFIGGRGAPPLPSPPRSLAPPPLPPSPLRQEGRQLGLPASTFKDGQGTGTRDPGNNLAEHYRGSD